MSTRYEDNDPINTLKYKSSKIVGDKQLSVEEKISQLNRVHEEIEKYSEQNLDVV